MYLEPVLFSYLAAFWRCLFRIRSGPRECCRRCTASSYSPIHYPKSQATWAAYNPGAPPDPSGTRC
ncbi:MAG: hypothetical protein BYD32DRAFT_414755 [Podila humilis]|nr:MAG: hypothetical protein BYD32DRAFT_414755 [Podila humilis]